MRCKKERKSIAKLLIWMIFETIRIIPGEFILFSILDVLHAGSYVLVMWATQNFFESIGNIVKGKSVTTAVMMLLLLAGTKVFAEICNGVDNYPTEFLSPKVLAEMNKKLQNKVSEMNVEEMEKPNVLDCLNNAQKGIENAYFGILTVTQIFTFYIPYFLFMGIYLKNLSVKLISILLLVFIPSIFEKTVRFHVSRIVEEENANEYRKSEYYEAAICDRSKYKETRLLGAYDYFIKLYRDTQNRINMRKMKGEIKNAKVETIIKMITIMGYTGIIILLGMDLVNGNISISAFAAVFSGVEEMFGLAEEAFGGAFKVAFRYAVYIANYKRFLDFPVESVAEGVQKFNFKQGICLDDVHFMYPDAETEAIRGVSVYIPAGKTVAIVGENGSGKTTLAKLIMGLYRPNKGNVMVGGINTKENDISEIRKNFSVIFQNFQKYKMTLRENICISDPEIQNDSDEKLYAICQNVNLKIENKTFPHGLNTVLSREFGGVDVSGGEWQRIALARAVYRTRKMLILDEPTAAIDALEEKYLYEQFMEISKDKTSIIVTHRLGAAQIADMILVMHNGYLIEKGTHEELMKRNQRYAKMYHEQAKWYK